MSIAKVIAAWKAGESLRSGGSQKPRIRSSYAERTTEADVLEYDPVIVIPALQDSRAKEHHSRKVRAMSREELAVALLLRLHGLNVQMQGATTCSTWVLSCDLDASTARVAHALRWLRKRGLVRRSGILRLDAVRTVRWALADGVDLAAAARALGVEP